MSETEKKILKLLKENGGLYADELVADMCAKGHDESRIYQAMQMMIDGGIVKVTQDTKLQVSS